MGIDPSARTSGIFTCGQPNAPQNLMKSDGPVLSRPTGAIIPQQGPSIAS